MNNKVKDEWRYGQTCPFCGEFHTQKYYLNIICDCGAKMDLEGNTWW